jgi:hypothetical protein
MPKKMTKVSFRKSTAKNPEDFWTVETNMEVYSNWPNHQNTVTTVHFIDNSRESVFLDLSKSWAKIIGGSFREESTRNTKEFKDGRGNIVKVTRK